MEHNEGKSTEPLTQVVQTGLCLPVLVLGPPLALWGRQGKRSWQFGRVPFVGNAVVAVAVIDNAIVAVTACSGTACP